METEKDFGEHVMNMTDAEFAQLWKETLEGYNEFCKRIYTKENVDKAVDLLSRSGITGEK